MNCLCELLVEVAGMIGDEVFGPKPPGLCSSPPRLRAQNFTPVIRAKRGVGCNLPSASYIPGKNPVHMLALA